MDLAAARLTPPAPLAEGTQIGTLRQNFFGKLQPAEPVFAGAQVGPTEGWTSLADARTGVLALGGTDAQNGAGGSAVAILHQADAFIGRFLVTKDGGDVAPWHVPVQLHPTNPSWVGTELGPNMPSKS